MEYAEIGKFRVYSADVLMKVVVGSSDEDVEAFREMWNDIPRVTKEVYSPTTDETIDISVDTRQYEIRLSEDIAKTIKWQTVNLPFKLITN